MTRPKLDRPTANRTAFNLKGRFLAFVSEPGDSKPPNVKPKYMRLSTATGEHQIKLAKELRPLLYRSLILGEWVEVSGFQKLDSKQGTLKLKAAQVVSKSAKELPSSNLPAVPRASLPPARRASLPPARRASLPPAKPDCILICQKSDCCKRGSRQVAKALETELRDRGLQDQVTVKATGCMKRCKEGANLVMPDKTRYSRVRPEKASALLDKHCAKAKR